MTELTEEFLDIIGINEREDYPLSSDSEVLDSRSYEDLEIEFISNVKVRRTVPKVEVSYFSSSQVEDALGDMLSTDGSETTWEKAIPGYQYPTDGIVFRHNSEDLKAKLGTGDDRELVTAAYSAGYGLRSTIAREMGVDSLDIQCTIDLTRRDIRL